MAYAFPVDLYIYSNRIVAVLDCPGMTPAVELLPDDEVRVTGERGARADEGFMCPPVVFRNVGKYGREFNFEGYDTSKLEAELDNGVLTLTVPKRPEPKPVMVSVVRADRQLPDQGTEQVAKAVAKAHVEALN